VTADSINISDYNLTMD